MIKVPITTFVLSLSLAGCGGGSEPPAAKSNAANTRGNNAETAGSPANPTAGQPAPGNVETGRVNTTVPDPMDARTRKLEAIRQAGSDPSAPKTDVEAVLERSKKPAPENSDFAVALTDVVLERRTFRDHPVLAKVEKVTDGSRSTIKLFTTDGRTIDLPGRSIEKLSTASAASILKAAGLQTPPSQPSDRKAGAANRN
jgi:hypothetical protein